MSEEPLNELRRLMYQEKYEVVKTEISLKHNVMTVRVELHKDDDQKIIEADDHPEFFYFVNRLRQVPVDGTIQFRLVDSAESYYTNIHHFIEEDDRVKEISQQLQQGEEIDLRHDFPVYDALSKVLDNTVDADSITLKNRYAEVQAILTHATIHTYQMFEMFKSNNSHDPNRCEFFKEEVFNIYTEGYWQLSPVKAYEAYRDTSNLDLNIFAPRFSEQWKHKEDLFQDLSAQSTGIPFSRAWRYFTDLYRRYCEAVSPLITDLASAVEFKNGVENIQPSKSIHTSKYIIENDGRHSLLSCYYPEIRHSESHTDTRSDEEAEEVIFMDTRSGEENELMRLSFREVFDNTLMLQDLAVSMFMAAAFFQSANTLRMVQSPEFQYRMFDIPFEQ